MSKCTYRHIPTKLSHMIQRGKLQPIHIILIIVSMIGVQSCGLKRHTNHQTIDVPSVVQRHNVVNRNFDKLAALSVGNGKFAMTVDATGLQTFPDYYADGIPLGMQSEWGWHKFPNLQNFQLEETFEYVKTSKGNVPYAVSGQENPRARAASDFLRSNPHRIHLASIALVLDRQIPEMSAFTDVHQKLDLYTGVIVSEFKLEGEQVVVTTMADQKDDAIMVSVQSKLLEQGRLRLMMRFPDPLGEWKDAANHFVGYQGQSISTQQKEGYLAFNRSMDDFNYLTKVEANFGLSVERMGTNAFNIFPVNNGISSIDYVIRFAPTSQSTSEKIPFGTRVTSAKKAMSDFWESTAMIDTEGSTTTQAAELERRFVLSKYLTHIQSGGQYPPQETGLTFNSWYGRPHLEMFYWHIHGQALTGSSERMHRQLLWYKKILPEAEKLAKRQGYKGARWMKMTDPNGEDGPSNVGAFLIWQQPHVIYLSDLLYKIKKDIAIISELSPMVFGSAEFMADFAVYDRVSGTYRLGPPLIGAQERFNAKDTYNTSFEVAWWKQNIDIAIQWKKLLNQKVPETWQKVADGLPAIKVIDGKYTMAESAPDSYTNENYRTDHPMVLGIAGLTNYPYDKKIMNQTFDWVKTHWNWDQTWGWDYPMAAMAATQLGRAQDAVDVLLLDVQKNTYLKNGHNYQDARLTLYLPGNAAFLAAIAKMATRKDGFPKDGLWMVKSKGFLKG